MRQRYMQLKDLNEHLLRNLENGQQELDQLNTKIESLQEVSSLPSLSHSLLKAKCRCLNSGGPHVKIRTLAVTGFVFSPGNIDSGPVYVHLAA